VCVCVCVCVWFELTAKQAFYHLSYTSNPFCSGYLEVRSRFFCQDWPVQPSSYFVLPAVARITSAPLRLGLANFLCLDWSGTVVLWISASRVV
jgi:hypothetical protein